MSNKQQLISELSKKIEQFDEKSRGNWCNRYKSIHDSFEKEYQKYKKDGTPLSDEILERLWYQRDNGVSYLSQGIVSREEFNQLKTELLDLTIKIKEDNSIDFYKQTTDKLYLWVKTKKLSKFYNAMRNRVYGAIYPDLVTSIITSSRFYQVYQHLDNVYKLDLPNNGNWFQLNIALKKELQECNSDPYILNILLWSTYGELNQKSNQMDISLDSDGIIQDREVYPLNQILYGPPGTGKTYNTINKALEIIGEKIKDENDRDELKKLFDKHIKTGRIIFTTFHQNMCYEDFIEGIKPIIDETNSNNNLSYEIKDGIFKLLANKAKIGNINKTLTIDEAIENFKESCSEQRMRLYTSTEKAFVVEYHGNTTFRIYPEGSKYEDLGNGYPASINHIIEYMTNGDLKTAYNSSYVKAIGEHIKNTTKIDTSKQEDAQKQNFVLIIDEINRGNVSQIFGELITLIEENKRLGNTEALTVTLPYSKQTFGVPSNLYIIGTMNTADRSVEALDTALRRRFSFTEMLPDPECLFDYDQKQDLKIGNIVLKDLLTTINQRIELLLDCDHQIGHSYFIGIKTLDDLCHVFNNKITPLLQEYFFNDYSKIGLVLGKGFFEQESTDNNTSVAFADFDDSMDLASLYQEKKIYRLKQINEDDVIDALNLLLNNNHYE